MRKRHIFVMIYIIVFSLLLVLMRSAHNLTNTTTSRIDAEKDNNPNIVFIGSSASYRYIIPTLIWKDSGITSYVIGSAAQSFSVTPSLISECEKHLHPSLYVIEIRRLIVNDVDEKNSMVKSASKVGSHSNKALNDNNVSNGIIDSFLGIFGVKQPDDKMVTLTFTNQEKLYNGSITVDFYKRQSEMETSSYRTARTPLSKGSEATLMGVINLCKKERLNVLFLSTPYVETKSFIAEENYTSDLIKNFGYPYLNYNYDYNNLGINFSTDFYDQRHVNILGAVKVTNYLTKYIKNNYTFMHNSTHGTKAFWENNYKTWTVTERRQKKNIYKAINK